MDIDEFRQQVLGNPQRRQQVLNMRSTLLATHAVPVAGGCQQMLPYSVNTLLMTVRSTPRRPSGAWIRGFERVGQAVLNRGYERTSGVLAGEVLTLALKEISMQSKHLVVTLNTNRPDVHGESLPYDEAAPFGYQGRALICR